jgi:HlyD family secretion protein
MKEQQLSEIAIGSEERRRNVTPAWIIFCAVLLLTALAIFFAIPRESDRQRLVDTMGTGAKKTEAAKPLATPALTVAQAADERPGEKVILTVSGYIVNRERIELSPRFVGVVEWVGVKKGDRVDKGQVLVRLEDSEQQANLLQAQGAFEAAKVALADAELKYRRVKRLAEGKIESVEAEDQARLNVEAAKAELLRAQGALDYAATQVEWTVIRSPVDGVVLEKLVDENELVSPQSFGGERSPSTALLALADRNDLQVEIDVSEADLAKIHINQPARVSPEAYPDRTYKGYVAEIAPEANRQKGTLQIKVQIENPDEYLTPQLTAKVDFLEEPGAMSQKQP